MTSVISITPQLSPPPAHEPAPPARRVAWLLNHSTLREFEVPLIRSLGYEVYTPKKLPYGDESVSASIDHGSDRYLTLPQESLAILNNHNFYEDDLTPEVKQHLNAHFDTVICASLVKLIDNIIHHFAGCILVRAFGRERPLTYSDYFRISGGQRLLSRIWAIQERFWMAPLYRSIPLVEDPLLKNRSLVLPLGLPDRILSHRGENTGSDPRLLFVCPRIATQPLYYGPIYEEFKRNFGHFNYVVAGQQPKPVKNDPHVAGFVDQETYLKWFREMRVMYYHSREPRHIHYHPLEAIAFGMPVVFLRGGLMEQFGGRDQPGACDSAQEAQRKVKALLGGDQKLAADIRQAQSVILDEFSPEYNRQEWQRVFTGEIMKTPIAATSGLSAKNNARRERTRPRKIAIMLSAGYRGGTLRAAKDLAKMLHVTAKKRGDPLEIIFSCLADIYDIKAEFSELLDLGIAVRETHWGPISKEELKAAAQSNPFWLKADLEHDNYVQPFDGSRQFSDCDFRLIVSDRLTRPMAPVCQYAVLSFDYIQRHVPEIFSSESWIYQKEGFLPTVRGADFALCTTPSTAADLNSYAGVPRSRIVQLPMYCDTMKDKPAARLWKEDYLLWITNPTPHKNHDRTLRALLKYYEELGGTLKTIMIGPGTDVFRKRDADLPPYAIQIRKLLMENIALRSHVTIAGELPDARYISALKYAKFMLHTNLNDNGTFTVLDAAHAGTPALSARYPAMEFMDDYFKLNLNFFDPYDIKSLAAALHDMENRCDTIPLPSPAILETYSWQYQADDVYDLIVSRLNV